MFNRKQQEMRRIHHIHFVGIGGVGMSGIAEVLLQEGYEISGSDLSQNAMTKRLEQLGAKIYQGHSGYVVDGADVVVISSAIKEDNSEVIAAKASRIPIIPRAEMLAELMRFRSGIAVSGTHGKTTTTSLVASLLAEAGLDPTFVIGGRLNSASTNARLGIGRYLVAEADESDASFLRLQPTIAVVTNIEEEHMETYHNSPAELKQAFITFLHRLPFYGLAIICIDDANVQEIMPNLSRQVITYGFDERADVRALNVSQVGTHTYFNVKRSGCTSDLSLCLNLAGEHNVLNALAAICIAMELDIADEVIYKTFEKFSGVGRRFQQLGFYHFEGGKALLIDDYGHHPREIEVTIKAARKSWPNKRVVMIFQPHRYSRTRDLFDAFIEVLSKLDVLLLLDVYPASESPIEGADSDSLSRRLIALGKTPVLVRDKEALPQILDRVLQDGDVVFAQGAGSISAIARELLEKNNKKFNK